MSYLLSIDCASGLVRRYRRGAYGGLWLGGAAVIDTPNPDWIISDLEEFRATGKMGDECPRDAA